MSKIELILISVSYDDFLDITLVKNKDYFDNIIVVTDLEDEKTVEVCKKYDIECLRTNGFYRNGRQFFDKGVGVNLAIDNLKHKEWVLSLDADIILPDDFRNKLFDFGLEKNKIYGCRRYEIRTYQEWLEIQKNPELIKKRFLFRGIFSGFFQLFHYQSEMAQKIIEKYKKLYPETGCNSELDWHFKLLMGGDYIYNPPLVGNEPHPFNIINNPHANQNYNDYCIGTLKELPFTVTHLGMTGQNANSRTTPKFI